MDADQMLIKKMRRGDEEAFDAFVRKHYGEILSYCRYHCRDLSYAEDLAQETFLRFFGSLPGYRHVGKARNYLYTIAGNLCRDYYKKKKELPLEGRPEDFKGELQNSEAEGVIDKVAVEESLKSLPGELREVIVLYYFQGLKLKEISEVLHIGLPLAKYRLRQAKKRLEGQLGEG